GTGWMSPMTSAECGNMPSWLRKWTATVHPLGTVSVSPPSRKPLKFRAPLSPVRPAINSNPAVRVAVSALSQAGSTTGAGTVWAAAPPAAPRLESASVTAARPGRVVGLVVHRLVQALRVRVTEGRVDGDR